MIIDNYNRIHTYLRISLTDNCNLRCFYCMPDEDYEFTPASRLMQQEEILKLATLFVKEGVTKIRLTGGEPLVRKDAAAIIKSLAPLPVELTLTTNGTRLHEFLPVLKEAKIRTINISLDTLQQDKFLLITRRDQHELVMQNVALMIKNGIRVKVNVVLMNDFNDGEINDFIEWTKHQPIEVRFIEFMPFAGNRWTSNQVFPMADLLKRVATKYEYDIVPGGANDTARHFRVPAHLGSFAVISTMTAPFCNSCNRMRLTADGKLKNCLFSKGETDLLTPLRNGANILPLIHQNIKAKAESLGGQFSTALSTMDSLSIQNRSMISIGG